MKWMLSRSYKNSRIKKYKCIMKIKCLVSNMIFASILIINEKITKCERYNKPLLVKRFSLIVNSK